MREYIKCSKCNTQLIKHPNEPATDPKLCVSCWKEAK